MKVNKEKIAIGIIGLGRIGMPVAKKYLANGYSVHGCDLNSDRCTMLKDYGGFIHDTPQSVAGACSFILVIVLDDQQFDDVMNGKNGLSRSLKSDAVVVCMSTINKVCVEHQAKQLLQKKAWLIDCPFTGGVSRVENGNLTLIIAAPEQQYNYVKPHLELIGNIFWVGRAAGMAQAYKHCNQLVVGAVHVAAMELVGLANRLDLDLGLLKEIISCGIAGNDYLKLLLDAIIYNHPSPGSLGQMCKDIAIVDETIETTGMTAFQAEAVVKYFKIASDLNMKNNEGADLIKVVEYINK